MFDWTGITIVDQQNQEPVDTDDLRDYLCLSGDLQETLLTSLIKASRQTIEKALSRTIVQTTYRLFFNSFPSDNEKIRLVKPPVQSVTSINYIDTNGNTQVFDSSNYRTNLYDVIPSISLEYGCSYPSVLDVKNAVWVDYVAGYSSVDDVPQTLKVAILALAADLYEHREANIELKLEENKIVNLILSTYKVPLSG